MTFGSAKGSLKGFDIVCIECGSYIASLTAHTAVV